MATKDKELKPPERLPDGASEAEVAEFDRQRAEYEQAVADAQKEAAAQSPQVQDAP